MCQLLYISVQINHNEIPTSRSLMFGLCSSQRHTKDTNAEDTNVGWICRAKGILNLHCKKGPPTALSRGQKSYLSQSARKPRQYIHGPGTHTSSAGVFVLFPGVKFIDGTASQRGIWRELRSRIVRRRGKISPVRKSGRCAGDFTLLFNLKVLKENV